MGLLQNSVEVLNGFIAILLETPRSGEGVEMNVSEEADSDLAKK